MKLFVTLLFLTNSLFCYSQTENRITKLEIYGRIIIDGMSLGLPLVGKSEIKKKSTIYVELKDEIRIEVSKVQDHIDGLEVSQDQFDFGEFNALLIVHYSKKKKEKYYIAGGEAGIYKDNIRYEYSCPFISTVYSFLPVYYYEYESPYYYKKPCE